MEVYYSFSVRLKFNFVVRTWPSKTDTTEVSRRHFDDVFVLPRKVAPLCVPFGRRKSVFVEGLSRRHHQSNLMLPHKVAPHRLWWAGEGLHFWKCSLNGTMRVVQYCRLR